MRPRRRRRRGRVRTRVGEKGTSRGAKWWTSRVLLLRPSTPSRSMLPPLARRPAPPSAADGCAPRWERERGCWGLRCWLQEAIGADRGRPSSRLRRWIRARRPLLGGRPLPAPPHLCGNGRRRRLWWHRPFFSTIRMRGARSRQASTSRERENMPSQQAYAYGCALKQFLFCAARKIVFDFRTRTPLARPSCALSLHAALVRDARDEQWKTQVDLGPAAATRRSATLSWKLCWWRPCRSRSWSTYCQNWWKTLRMGTPCLAAQAVRAPSSAKAPPPWRAAAVLTRTAPRGRGQRSRTGEKAGQLCPHVLLSPGRACRASPHRAAARTSTSDATRPTHRWTLGACSTRKMLARVCGHSSVR